MRLLATILFFSGLAISQSQPGSAQLNQRPGNPNAGNPRIVKEVRHELAMLPYYTVFDDLEYQVDGNTVTLLGDVTNPTLKNDAGKAMKKIEGVEQVRNEIHVLPLSPMDEELRRNVARALFNAGGLAEYSWSIQPSIRIIVENGHVTLKGFVNNEGDKNLANITASGIPGVFSVSNELQVSGGKAEKEK